MKLKIDLVVTRHPALLTVLIERGLVDTNTPIVTHASEDQVRGKHVLGVLPHRLSSLCGLYTELSINVPPEMRGRELTVEQVREYASAPVTYSVAVVDLF